MTEDRGFTVEIPSSLVSKIDRFFREGLQRSRAKEVQDPQAFRLGIARRRYREGFTDTAGFIEELQALQVPEDQVDLELIAGDLEAAYDYSMDLIAVWRDAFRKGHIDIATFTEQLSRIVLVPERVQTYVARELARLKPEEVPSLAPVPKAYYETDAGKLAVDTIRRQRRKKLLTREREISILQEYGMPLELATATADNDDARLADKGDEE